MLFSLLYLQIWIVQTKNWMELNWILKLYSKFLTQELHRSYFVNRGLWGGGGMTNDWKWENDNIVSQHCKSLYLWSHPSSLQPLLLHVCDVWGVLSLWNLSSDAVNIIFLHRTFQVTCTQPLGQQHAHKIPGLPQKALIASPLTPFPLAMALGNKLTVCIKSESSISLFQPLMFWPKGYFCLFFEL